MANKAIHNMQELSMVLQSLNVRGVFNSQRLWQSTKCIGTGIHDEITSYLQKNKLRHSDQNTV